MEKACIPSLSHSEPCIHARFEAQAARTPEAVALIVPAPPPGRPDTGTARSAELQLTYRELNQRANQVAHYLEKQGVGPNVLVAICVERSLAMVVGILGILKAGGAYVPLDPTYPRERLAFMLEDTHAPLLLTQQHLRASLPKHQARVICLDTDWPEIARESATNPGHKASADSRVYIIYTSGSTGKPKGVLITHANLMRSNSARELYYPAPVRRFLLLSSFAFDSSVAGIFWTLNQGGTLFLPPQGSEQDVQQLAAGIETHHISHTLCLPSLYRHLLEQAHPSQLLSLQVAIVAGEACPSELAALHYRLLPQTALYNEYGPTEGTVWSTVYKIPARLSAAPVSIGRAIPGVETYVLDAALQPVPPGSPGELYIGGPGLAQGYLNHADLTAEKFIPHPCSEQPGARLYKTGDVASYRPDGNLDFLGRADHQVKLRGFRIELGEIEAILRQHPAVRDTVVILREDTPGDKRLVAYAILQQGAAPTVSALRSHLQACLPEYMIPAAFVFLAALPLTPNGKVDRASLPAPERKRPALDQAYVAPRTDLERLLADIWCDILKLDRVGVHDRFFELGGDSLLAAQFIGKLQRELQASIFIVTIFDAPSIAQYAALLETDYADAVARRCGHNQDAVAQPLHGHTSRPGTAKIDAVAVLQMRACIPPLPSWHDSDGGETKNPPAMFILAPPRSGTTLLRVMLAGHPQLFAASELQLLGFNTLAERRQAFTGRFSLWLEGTIRAIMELHRCTAEEAKHIMAEYEHSGYTTKQFYRVLQEWIGDRLLVDKSPSYVLDCDTLEKAERDFDNALYIHLIRHPYAMVRSFERRHMEQVLFLRDHRFSNRQLAELVWVVSHQNAVEFLRYIPPHRQYRLHFENLVQQPRASMEALCQALCLEFQPDMVHPYKNLDGKMTDGIYAASTPMGDPTLLDNQAINARLAHSWRGVLHDDFLSDITWHLAATLGYARPPGASPGSSGGEPMARRRAAQRRRDLLAQHRQSQAVTAPRQGERHE
jgi:amino acid adenylation domain-containing protein